jgi:taurine transport system substrate-binding protein
MAFTSRITLLAALAVAAFQAQAVNVTVAYQTSAEPAKVGQHLRQNQRGDRRLAEI